MKQLAYAKFPEGPPATPCGAAVLGGVTLEHAVKRIIARHTEGLGPHHYSKALEFLTHETWLLSGSITRRDEPFELILNLKPTTDVGEVLQVLRHFHKELRYEVFYSAEGPAVVPE